MSSQCPVCRSPIAANTARCSECLVSIVWTNGAPAAHHPFIKPGEILYFTDATRSVLPGRERLAGSLKDGTRYEHTPQGALVTVTPKRAFDSYEARLRSRDACVRASFVALDPGITVGCLGRIDVIEGAKLTYVFEVDPTERRFCIDRGFNSPDVARYSSLVDYTPSAAIAPLGQVNVLELRMQGPTLEARINDRHVMTVHDAVLGIGAAGLRVGTKPTATVPLRAMVQWFEMREVIA